MEDKKINSLSLEEKNNILKNARSSFVHGIEHLVKYESDEKHIKFAILHIFHTVELITKAYLGEVNSALLRPNIDQKSSKTADISTLINRMTEFSKVQFSPELINKIEKLRYERNKIEHKEFILDNERKMLQILFDVICQLMIFSKENLNADLRLDLSSKLKDKLDKMRLELDPMLKKALESMDKAKREKPNIQTTECPYCLNKTIAYYRESRVKCFYCHKELFVLYCKQCDKLYLSKDTEDWVITGGICPDCYYKGLGDFEPKDDKEEWDRAIKELEESLPEENFKS